MTEQLETEDDTAEVLRPAFSLVETADYSNYAPTTLMRMRSQGTGPPSFKRNGRVMFYRDDVDRWLEARRDIRPTTWRKV